MGNKNTIFKSLEIIENRITERLTVESIASGVYFSKYHYQRLFREIVGDSVMEYVTKRKLTLAGRALLETDTAILDIALDYGYDSRSSFTRSFKAYMGVTPTDYRKYGLTAITQKKERLNMTYSKTTDEMIREINSFVAQAKNVAETARKQGASDALPQPFSAQFWNAVADETDTKADRVKAIIDRIASLSNNPDEITNRFAIVKIFDDIGFETHLLAFHVNITMVGRMQLEYIPITKPICDLYSNLARNGGDAINKMLGYMSELASLIIEDMRNTAVQKIEDAAQKGRAVVNAIDGYDYIKSEIESMVNGLTQTSDVTAFLIGDYLFRLQLLSPSIMTDILRSGNTHKAMFDGMEPFKESLQEAYDFLRPIEGFGEPEFKSVPWKVLDDIAFQSNILFFYIKGEVEKLRELATDSLRAICEKIARFIQFAEIEDRNQPNELKKQTVIEAANMLDEIASDMTAEAKKFGEHGGVIAIIAEEFGKVAEKTRCLAGSLELDGKD